MQTFAVEVRPANAAKGRDVQAAERTEVEFADGVLRITGEAKNELFGASGSVEITVQLPAGSRVEATAASAELRGVGRLGDVIYDSSHGDIKLDEAASVRLATQAGGIAVGRLNGPAEITTAKGDIRIAEATSSSVVLRTESGNVSIDAAAGVSASLDAGTSYGRIQNSLKNNGIADLTIHATTVYGDITARSL